MTEEDKSILERQGRLVLIAEDLRRDVDSQDKRLLIVSEHQQSLNKRMKAFEEMLKNVRG